MKKTRPIIGKSKYMEGFGNLKSFMHGFVWNHLETFGSHLELNENIWQDRTADLKRCDRQLSVRQTHVLSCAMRN